jgi:hypothetical protein
MDTHPKTPGSLAPVASAVLLGALLLAGAACGHSEEEWQAMLRSQHELQERCQSRAVPVLPAEAPPGAITPACGRDVDCKGDRICNLGRCVSPH